MKRKISIVVNVFGAPCSGKSTLAAGLVHELKKAGKEAVLVPETFKPFALARVTPDALLRLKAFTDQVWHENQYYGLADFIVTDAPLELCAFYNDVGSEGHHEDFDELPLPFTNVVMDLRQEETNIRIANIYLVPDRYEYSTLGRYQSEEQAYEIHQRIMEYVQYLGMLGHSATPSMECGVDVHDPVYLADVLLRLEV